MDEAASASGPRKYTCPDCSRHYRAKETLQRHRKNHSRNLEHICNLCEAGFYRKDLLQRHFRIHQGAEASDGRSTDRQRSRKACDRCSRLKIKCSSSPPCANCARYNSACTFSTYNSSRASFQRTGSTSSTSSPPRMANPQNGSAIARDSPVALDLGDSIVQLSDVPELEQFNEHAVGDTVPLTTADDAALSIIPRPSEPAILESFSLIDAWPQTMTWPWLHEDLFLQYDPQFDPDSTDLSPPGIDSSLDQLPVLLNGASSCQTVPAWHPPMANNTDISGGVSEDTIGSQFQFISSNQVENSFTGEFIPTANPPASDARRQLETEPASGRIQPQDSYASKPSSPPLEVTNQEHNAAGGIKKSTSRRNQRQQQAVKKFVEFACDLSRPMPDPIEYREFLDQMCIEIEQAFGLHKLRPRFSNTNSGNLLDYFVELFLKNFHPLWPLFWSQGLVYDRISPLLYITLTSVGSVYASNGAATYGFMCHEKIREKIILAPLQSYLAEEVYVPLCQSLLLIQASTLYFGQRQAFSIAQQLGGIIICHARKMNLFNDGLASDPFSESTFRLTMNQDEIVWAWIKAETRKRLAFGMLRAEVFISHLLNSRSLLSYEEYNIQLPCSVIVWQYDFTDLRQHVMSQYSNQDRRREILYSDLVRIAMDRNESLPNLQPGDFELLLFGIQQIVWQFGHDPDMMSRLSRKINSDSNANPQNDLFSSWSFSGGYFEQSQNSPDTWGLNAGTAAQPYHTDLLDCSLRDMNDLKVDYQRCFSTLRKWKRSFVATCFATDIVGKRNSLLASRLLYHLSFIRISADVHKFHLCNHQLVKGPVDLNAIRSIYQWASSQEAKVGLEHSCAIWSLVSREIEREESSRASFNILTHIALYHASAVIWVYAGTHRSRTEAALDMIETSGNSSRADLLIHRSNTAKLASTLAALVNSVTPAWKHTSSFATVISMMAAQPFPMLPGLPEA